MFQVIVYPQENGSIALLIPTGELPLEDVAQKDVPAGLPYLILNPEDVPADHTFFNAWEANFDAPHGYGIGAEAYFARKAAEATTTTPTTDQ